jgi:hypothetical protein
MARNLPLVSPVIVGVGEGHLAGPPHQVLQILKIEVELVFASNLARARGADFTLALNLFRQQA